MTRPLTLFDRRRRRLLEKELEGLIDAQAEADVLSKF